LVPRKSLFSKLPGIVWDADNFAQGFVQQGANPYFHISPSIRFNGNWLVAGFIEFEE